MSTIASRRKALQAVTFDRVKDHATHAGLWLTTYLSEQERKSDEKQVKESNQEKKQGLRADHIGEVCRLSVPALYSEWYKRWLVNLRAYNAASREAKAISRISVGLGEESVLETAVALHHTFGVPYIAGSALKGLLASYIRQKFLSAERGEEEKKQWQQALLVICGDQLSAGFITFFDAFYIPKEGESPLVPDVITIHHQKYYQGTGEAPADWDSPIPVPFPSARGCYLIALAAPELDQREAWITLTFDLLEDALKTMGIGAKTSSGYGRMEYQVDKEGDLEVKPKISAGAQALIDEIDGLAKAGVNQQIHNYYAQWKKGYQGETDRLHIAQAIVKKVRKTGYEERKREKDWYQELLQFLQPS